MNAKEAAAHLGLTDSQVRRLCKRGDLPGATHTSPGNPTRGEWVIPETALAAYRAACRELAQQPRGKGRRPKASEGRE